METTLKIIGRLGLVLTLVPSFMYLFDMIELGTMKWIMIAGTVLWLAIAPVVQKLNKQSGLS